MNFNYLFLHVQQGTAGVAQLVERYLAKACSPELPLNLTWVR